MKICLFDIFTIKYTICPYCKKLTETPNIHASASTMEDFGHEARQVGKSGNYNYLE